MIMYDDIPHTEACLKFQQFVRETLERAQAWRVQNPLYCRGCGGSGIVLYDSGDPDVGLGPTYVYCSDCMLAGMCPRCGDWHGRVYVNDVEDFPAVAITCEMCGYPFDGNQVCVENILAAIEGTTDCICEEERYAAFLVANPEFDVR